MDTVGFIGLGAMGAPMARNVDDAGFDLVVYNRSTDREQPFAEAGVSVADSPEHLTKRVDVVCLMLTDGDAVAEVLERDRGVLAGLSPDTTVVQMSTIGYDETLAVADLVTEAGGRFVEVPVSGTVGPASAGTLVGLAGGEEEDLASVRPVLDAMCGEVIHCGAVGQGTNMKLFVNLLLGDVMAAFAEALVFGRATGLALEDMQAVVGSSGLASPLFEGKGAQIAAGDFEARFPIDYQYKDLALAQDRAGSVGAPIPLAAISREAFNAARARGHGTDDIAAVVRHMATLADVTTTV